MDLLHQRIHIHHLQLQFHPHHRQPLQFLLLLLATNHFDYPKTKFHFLRQTLKFARKFAPASLKSLFELAQIPSQAYMFQNPNHSGIQIRL
jgi:hypothetical protein